MDIVTKKKLNILIQLAQADKDFASSERELIYRIAKECNFAESAVTDLIRNPEPIDSLGALSIKQKLDYLMSAIELIYADQKVFKSEVLFTKNVAIKLGFKSNVVDYLVENYKKFSLDELKTKVSREFPMN